MPRRNADPTAGIRSGSARRSTSRGRSRTSATSPACIASRRAARARRSRTSSTHEQVFARARAADGRSRCPYLSFSGGEPMLHPHFFEMVEYVCSRGGQLKIETNGHYLTPENCARLKRARRQGGAGEPRRRDRARRSTACACAASSTRAVEGIRNLRARRRADRDQLLADALQHRTRSARVVDLAFELGAYSFYTGRTMYTGNAVKAWRHLEVPDERVRRVFRHAAREDARSTAAACASTSTRRACSRSCATGCTIRRRCSSCCPTGW